MTMQWFILEVNPEPWAVGPVGYARRGNKMSAYVGRNQQLDAYKKAVREALGPQEMLQGKFHIICFFWRNRAQYSTPRAARARKNEADATNMAKATEDALQGILIENDRDVQHIEGVIVEQGPDVIGRVLLGVEIIQGDVPDAVAMIPPHVMDLMAGLDKRGAVPDQSDLTWGTGEDF